MSLPPYENYTNPSPFPPESLTRGFVCVLFREYIVEKKIKKSFFYKSILLLLLFFFILSGHSAETRCSTAVCLTISMCNFLLFFFWTFSNGVRSNIYRFTFTNYRHRKQRFARYYYIPSWRRQRCRSWLQAPFRAPSYFCALRSHGLDEYPSDLCLEVVSAASRYSLVL